MRIAFALSGFHSVHRGAEVALLSIAQALAETGDEVTVFGSGDALPDKTYRFHHVGAIARERFEKAPHFPPFRSEVMWEDATFALALLGHYRPADFDVTITCAYPFSQWALRRPTMGRRPLQVFVTQNGDWPAYARNAEYRFFSCDGLVCTNPDYFARNAERWPSALIPNGIDPARFGSGPIERERFGLPAQGTVVLMVSAFIESKRVADGVRAVAALPGAHLVVAGDGPLRDEVEQLANALLPDRFTRLSLTADAMPALYRAADVFLHMSLLESFGNVFVEAMASGLPIVGHDTPRLRWIVGGDHPLCDTTDAAALHIALERAAQRGRGLPDPRSPEFAWSAIAERYREFLTELITRRDTQNAQ